MDIVERTEEYSNFGSDLKYSCSKLNVLADKIDHRLTEFSGDIKNVNERELTAQLIIALNHEIKSLANTWNTINEEYNRLCSMDKYIKSEE